IEMVPQTSSDVPETLFGHLTSSGEVTGGIPIPGLASWLSDPSTGRATVVQGLDTVPADQRPTIRQVNVVHLAWDVMVGLGTLLFLFTLWYWASAGSFAAISTLLGSPVLGAFLIMEAAGIGGMTLSLVALPGLLASGLGALVFVGLDRWTGLGNFSLALPSVPPAVTPTLATMGWALAMGVAGALLGWLIRWVGLSLRPIVHLNRVLVTSALGLVIGLTAMAYQLISGDTFTQVLFSGQDALPELVDHAADYSLAVLVLLILCKAFVYGVSLSAFRGGPVFPSMFIGAALGIAASGLPGMDLAPAIGMGIGAMCATMLRLPLTSTLLATLLLGADGVTVTPQVVVAVAVAFVITNVLPVPGPKEPEPVRPTPGEQAPGGRS
ncbi:MAG TPA: chloride channel protein, partial [Propionibacteriaceae bacterium]